MNTERYFPPNHAKGQFHCPHCGVYSKQRWSHLCAVGDIYSRRSMNTSPQKSNIFGLTLANYNLNECWTLSLCEHCHEEIIWLGMEIVYPKLILVEKPNEDLNIDIQEDYMEAAKVLSNSPRSAAAILRLALQKLCKQLGEKGKNINDDIGEMVKKGLNPTIQKSLDALRITGNNAVHPGELDLTEDKERVIKLFALINFIAEKMITEPKEICSFYDDLPVDAKQAVEKRDVRGK